MLVISRRKGQRITIGDDIDIMITELHRSSVKLGITAPYGYVVLRGEIRDSIERANREAAQSALENGAPVPVVIRPLRAYTFANRAAPRQAADTGHSQADNAGATPSLPATGPPELRHDPRATGLGPVKPSEGST